MLSFHNTTAAKAVAQCKIITINTSAGQLTIQPIAATMKVRKAGAIIINVYKHSLLDSPHLMPAVATTLERENAITVQNYTANAQVMNGVHYFNHASYQLNDTPWTKHNSHVKCTNMYDHHHMRPCGKPIHQTNQTTCNTHTDMLMLCRVCTTLMCNTCHQKTIPTQTIIGLPTQLQFAALRAKVGVTTKPDARFRFPGKRNMPTLLEQSTVRDHNAMSGTPLATLPGDLADYRLDRIMIVSSHLHQLITTALTVHRLLSVNNHHSLPVQMPPPYTYLDHDITISIMLPGSNEVVPLTTTGACIKVVAQCGQKIPAQELKLPPLRKN